MSNKLFVMHHAPIAKRRGEIIGSRTDSDLSEYGVKVANRQAEHLYRLLELQALKNIGQLILSSPLRRAIQTSEIIATKCDMDISTDYRLRAQDFGVLDGMTFDEVLQDDTLKNNLWEYMAKSSRDDHKGHGGESNTEIASRVAEFKNETLASLGAESRPLIITHGTVIDAMIATIDRKRLDEIEGKNRIFEGRVIEFTNSTYYPVGEPLTAFYFIPGVATQNSIDQQKALIRNYMLSCKGADERVHLEKLLDIFERENDATQELK